MMPRTFIVVLLLLLVCVFSLSQTPSGQPANERGVIRLRVRVKIDNATRGLSRKRFFLLKGSLEQNKTVIEAIERQPMESRDCYYRRHGASQALINWLKDGDCESVYCREIDADAAEGPNAVPEFQNAINAGEKEFGSRELARKWLTVNLAEDLRDGFYETRQQQLRLLVNQAATVSGAPVQSVMTDRNGTAYFVDLEPGVYVVSNMLPAEVGQTGVTWNCEMRVKQGDLSSERPYLISNRQDRNVKCVGVERPLPACSAPNP